MDSPKMWFHLSISLGVLAIVLIIGGIIKITGIL